MSESNDLSPLESSLGSMFRRMGLPDPVVMSRLIGDWDEVAGDPWKGRSEPIMLEDGTLIVQASAPSMVAFLRYGESALIERLGTVLGAGVVDRIEVRPPPRG